MNEASKRSFHQLYTKSNISGSSKRRNIYEKLRFFDSSCSRSIASFLLQVELSACLLV